MVEEVEEGEVGNKASVVLVEADIDQPRVGLFYSDLVVPRHVVVLATVLYSKVSAVGHGQRKRHLKGPAPFVQPNAEDGLILFEDCACDCVKLIEKTILFLVLHQNLLNLLNLVLEMPHHQFLFALEGKVVVRIRGAQFFAKQKSVELLVGQ